VRTWFPLLHKPAGIRPAQSLTTVWTTLYVLMGVATLAGAAASLRKFTGASRGIRRFYFLQLAANALWSCFSSV